MKIQGDVGKEGKTMRKFILSMLVPGLVLMCMLTISCKEQTRVLDPGDLSICSDPIVPSDYADFVEPDPPDSGDENSYGDRDINLYTILCAPDYEPQSGTMNWDSRDNSTQTRIEAIEGATMDLQVEYNPNPLIQVSHMLHAVIPSEALPEDTTLRICVPDPGMAAFGFLLVEDHPSTEPYTLTSTAYLTFKISGFDVADLESEDLTLLQWNSRRARWDESSGSIQLTGQNITGSLELTELGRFAVGTLDY
jgi:hypothetical protein